MKFKRLLNESSIVYKTCKAVREEVNPGSFLWLIMLGVILPIVSGDNYYSYLAVVIIGIVMVHFIFKFQKSLDGINTYIMYREILSFVTLCVAMVICYSIPIYFIEMLGNFITVMIFLWIIPPLITDIALIIPSLIDIILLGKIKNEKDFT